MIVVTAPTGQIGRQLVTRLLDAGEPVRVIARDPGRLDPAHREQIEIVVGSHEDPAVLDQALAGADALFFLVPPDPQTVDVHARYVGFAQAGAGAIRRHGVGHVVGVTSAGHGWDRPAGVLSAAFAMDDELARSGAAYRALSMPFYLENLLGQVQSIGDRGVFSLSCPPDRPLATVATADIAQVAAQLLGDRAWSGREDVLVFGPDRLTPVQMAAVISDVLERPVAFQHVSLEDFGSLLRVRGLPEQAVGDTVAMFAAQNDGVYDADWAVAVPTATDLRTWSERVLRPAVDG